jgi:hypothetical protein
VVLLYDVKSYRIIIVSCNLARPYGLARIVVVIKAKGLNVNNNNQLVKNNSVNMQSLMNMISSL